MGLESLYGQYVTENPSMKQLPQQGPGIVYPLPDAKEMQSLVDDAYRQCTQYRTDSPAQIAALYDAYSLVIVLDEIAPDRAESLSEKNIFHTMADTLNRHGVKTTKGESMHGSYFRNPEFRKKTYQPFLEYLGKVGEHMQGDKNGVTFADLSMQYRSCRDVKKYQKDVYTEAHYNSDHDYHVQQKHTQFRQPPNGKYYMAGLEQNECVKSMLKILEPMQGGDADDMRTLLYDFEETVMPKRWTESFMKTYNEKMDLINAMDGMLHNASFRGSKAQKGLQKNLDHIDVIEQDCWDNFGSWGRTADEVMNRNMHDYDRNSRLGKKVRAQQTKCRSVDYVMPSGIVRPNIATKSKTVSEQKGFGE